MDAERSPVGLILRNSTEPRKWQRHFPLYGASRVGRRTDPVFQDSVMPIFIVDDDAAILSSARFMLEGEGYTVATFESGSKLIAAFPQAKPCCIVIDYVLPDMTGLDAYERVRSSGGTAPVIIITGHPSAAIREKVRQAGLPLVEKAFVEDLLGAIEAIGPLH